MRSHSATQEITNLLWNQQFQCQVHISPALSLILDQINPVRTLLYPVSLTHIPNLSFLLRNETKTSV